MALHRFDLVFARRGDGPQPRFMRLIEEALAARGLSYFHCHHHAQAEALRHGIEAGDVQVTTLVDYMGRSFTQDYAFGCAVKDRGGIVVDDPDRVRAFGSKVVMHQELERAGVELPPTRIWRHWQPSRNLSIIERDRLGTRLIIKPANGSGAGGVQLDFDGSQAALDEARSYDHEDDYLIQEFVNPLTLDGRTAWFRVYNCFGRVFACWWHPDTHETYLVSHEEVTVYRLHELARISTTIAQISGYTWFSTEIALTERAGRRTFLPIDYLNNKCFMQTHSEVGPHGMPDTLAEIVAAEFASQTAQRVRAAHIAPSFLG